MKSILVIDDDVEETRSILEEVLDGYSLAYAGTGAEGLAQLSDAVGLVLLDLVMPATVGTDPEREGLAVMAEIARVRPNLPVVMLTQYPDPRAAVEAGRLGALDYISKLSDPKALIDVVDRALAMDSEPAAPGARRSRLGALLGSSERMQLLYAQIERIAPTHLPVLVLGPTGSGKELVAREIHRLSGRRGAFVPVHAAAISPQLVESELFGHVKGAFTTALQDRVGAFEAASDGTLLLDEIGTLSLAAQVKLLRVLEDNCVTRVGETMPRRVNARVVAATHANLLQRMRDDTFRRDLYHRLRVARIIVPPLNQHAEDVPALVEHFLQATIRGNRLEPRHFAPEALEVLRRQSWLSGNVRQLEHAVESAAVNATGSVIRPGDLDLDEDDDGLITVVNPETLYDDQTAGRTGFTSPSGFKREYGQKALWYVLRRAQREARSQAEAGLLLHFLAPGHTDQEKETFRQWFARMRHAEARERAQRAAAQAPDPPDEPGG